MRSSEGPGRDGRGLHFFFAGLGAWHLLLPRMSAGEELIYAGHHLEGVGDVDDVGLASGPTAVWIERDGAALADEAPTEHSSVSGYIVPKSAYSSM